MQTLKKDTNSYGSFVVPLINEKLPTDIRVITARKFKSKVWDLNKMIEVLKLEVEAKKRSLSVSTLFADTRTNFHMRNFLRRHCIQIKNLL